MATRFRMTHRMECDVDTFWTTFFDQTFNARVFSDMGFPSFRVAAQTHEGDAIRQRLEITPQVRLPNAVKKVLGDRFSYVEEGVFDKSAKVYRFTFLPPPGMRGDRATGGGIMTAEHGPDGTTDRIIEMNFDVRIFGIGGMLEGAAERAAQDVYGAHARASNAYFAERR
jgi:Protein of unknown function (DUF2505)